MDELVPPPLTHLGNLSPSPKNISLAKELRASRNTDIWSIISYLNPVTWLRHGVDFAYSMVSLGSNVKDSMNATDLGKTDDSKAEQGTSDEQSNNETSEAGGKPADNVNNFAGITFEDWQRDMTPYLAPVHLSLRTSQIANVGFPVDHKAIMWCYEVVESVSMLLKKLAVTSQDSGSIESFLKTTLGKSGKKKKRRANESMVDSMSHEHDAENNDENLIEPLRELMQRNRSLNAWRESEKTDLNHMYLGVDSNPIYALSSRYYTKDLGLILVAYFAIGCLAVAVPALRDATGHSLSDLLFAVSNRETYGLLTLTDTSLHNIWMLLGLDIVYPAIKNMGKYNSLGADTSQSGFYGWTYPYTMIALVLGVGGKIMYDYWSPVSVDWVWKYAGPFSVFVSIGVATVLRYFLVMYIWFLRGSIQISFSIVMFLARWTVWCKPVRKFVSSMLSKPIQFIRRYMVKKVLVGLFVMCFITAIVLMWTYKQGRMQGEVMSIDTSFFFSIVAMIVSFWFAVISVLFVILFPPRLQKGKEELIKITQKLVKAKREKNIEAVKELTRKKNELQSKSQVSVEELNELSRIHSVRMNSLLLIYLPAILYTTPTWYFAHEMIYGDVKKYSHICDILTTFGPEMITYAVCLSAISLHLLISRFEFNLVNPVGWLEEICGPDSVAFQVLEKKREYDNVDTGCLHEEGGRYAVYVECDADNLEHINDQIHLGPSFKVMSCRCETDMSLKSMDQWCSFCRCPRCGNLSSSLRRDESWSRRQNRHRKLAHLLPQIPSGFHSPCFLVIGLIVIAFYYVYHAYQHMYRFVYCAAAVAGLHLFCMIGEFATRYR